jgi:hypothetical protein
MVKKNLKKIDHLNYMPKNILKVPLKRLFEPEFESTFEPDFELTFEPEFESTFEPEFELTFEPEFELTFEPEFELTLILNPLPLFHSLTKIINLEIDIQKQNYETY